MSNHVVIYHLIPCKVALHADALPECFLILWGAVIVDSLSCQKNLAFGCDCFRFCMGFLMIFGNSSVNAQTRASILSGL